MSHSAIVIQFVARQDRQTAALPPKMTRITGMDRSGDYLKQIAALLGIPEQEFFREMPASGRATPDPFELSQLVEVFRRIESPDDRRRVLEVAKSAIGPERVVESSPMHGRGMLPSSSAASLPGDASEIEQ